jgi:two-component system sensor histidine kinase MprB
VSLRIRLALVVATTFAVVVIGCIYAAHVSARQQLRSETDHFLQQRASDSRFPRDPGGFRPPPSGSPEDTGRQFANFDTVVQFIDADGSVQHPIPGQPALPVSPKDKQLAASGGTPVIRDAKVNGTAYRVITAPTPNGGALQIGRSVADSNNVLATLDTRLLLIALLGTLVAAGLAWLIARRMVRPVEELTDAAEQVAETQDLSHHIEVTRRDEIGRLGTSFNTMLDALGTSRDQQQRLVMDASHELRTPLTALRTNIELLQRAPAMNDAERAELVGAARVELDELGELVTELVELATDARADEPLQDVDLGDLAGRVVARHQRRRDHSITLTLHDPAVVSVRAAALDRALGNLVENACKFSPPDTPVEVAVEEKRIEVRDRGPGIPPGERERVFDRFYRTVDARTQPGSGLGLSIVKQIVDLHGGTVVMLGRDGGGTVARIDLP